MTIDISGIDKAKLLKALHANTRPLGMGFLHDLGRDLTDQEAADIVREHTDGIPPPSTTSWGAR